MSAKKDKVNSVITNNGSDVTVRTQTLYTARDDWGKPMVNSYVDRTIKAVKDNYLTKDFILNQSGRLSGASVTLIVSGDESFDSRTDKIIFDNRTYNIIEVQNLELANEILAKLIVLGED